MTITFPRAMPLVGIGRQVFEPQRIDYESPDAGGRLNSIAAGPPRWRASWTLASVLSTLQSDEWRAWLASLNGSSRQFFGRDQERPYPRNYQKGFAGLSRAGGGGFDGTASSWSQTIGADGQGLLTLNGLPAGFQFAIGDYVDFRWTTGGKARRALVRSLVAVNASGGGVAVLSVTPVVPALVPGGAVANLDHPECLMRLITSATEVTEMDRRRVAGARITALQELLA